MRLATTTAILFLTGVLLAAPQGTIEEFSGKVIGVVDGDTIKVLVNKESVTIRLEGIDAPESGQSYGKKSKDALAGMVAGKVVTVKKTGTDRYKRILGVVVIGDLDVNATMVQDGWAWHFKKYNSETRLSQLEDVARKAKRGLWADDNALAPWDFRARKNTPQAVLKIADSEATYWLNTSSGVRHNESCEHFQKTKRGRFCELTEGKACGICGG